MAEYRAQFPSAFESVGEARRAVVDFARHWFSGEDLCDIESAVGEALANAAEHGSKTGGMIDIKCRCVGDRFTVEVHDSGSGFERWNASDYIRPMSTSSRGYGMFIMRELMDEVEYSERGSRLRLMKRLPGDLNEAEACLRA